MLKIGLPVCIHANHAEPRTDDAEDYERRGFLGPNFLFCHYITATESDRAAMARTKTPLSYSTFTEMRLGTTGNARRALMKMREAGVLVSLSFDATSLSPPNMLEVMRVTRNMGIPQERTDTANIPPLGFYEVIQMATINGAKALGIGDVTGSLTPGKRADIIMLRANDVNIAPLANIETAVVMGATSSNVDTVLVDGRILKRNGALIACDAPEIVRRAMASSLRICEFAGGSLKPQCPGCAANAIHQRSMVC